MRPQSGIEIAVSPAHAPKLRKIFRRRSILDFVVQVCRKKTEVGHEMYLLDRTLESFLQEVFRKDMMSIWILNITEVIFSEGYVRPGYKVSRPPMREKTENCVSRQRHGLSSSSK